MSRMTLISCIAICVAGCGDDSGETPDGTGMTGIWSVTEVDGQPVPQGSSIDIEYRKDGEVVVEEFGHMTSIPPIDKEKFKASFDKLDRSGPHESSAQIKIDETNFDLKRKPTPPPSDPGS